MAVLLTVEVQDETGGSHRVRVGVSARDTPTSNKFDDDARSQQVISVQHDMTQYSVSRPRVRRHALIGLHCVYVSL